jgi:hypothetical protein
VVPEDVPEDEPPEELAAPELVVPEEEAPDDAPPLELVAPLDAPPLLAAPLDPLEDSLPLELPAPLLAAPLDEELAVPSTPPSPPPGGPPLLLLPLHAGTPRVPKATRVPRVSVRPRRIAMESVRREDVTAGTSQEKRSSRRVKTVQYDGERESPRHPRLADTT